MGAVCPRLLRKARGFASPPPCPSPWSMQLAATLVAVSNRQAADLADEIAMALARPAVADPAAQLVGVLFRRETRFRKFGDHELDRRCNCAVRLVAFRPPRGNRQVDTFPQINRPAFKRGNKPVVHLEAGLGMTIFKLRDCVSGD